MPRLLSSADKEAAPPTSVKGKKDLDVKLKANKMIKSWKLAT